MSGYLRQIKLSAQEAIATAFRVTYPESDPEGGTKPVYCSLDYPANPAVYPGVWVNYEAADLRTAGIAYTETDTSGNLLVRWRFSGHVTFTVVSLSNNENDLIYDQIITMVAFAAQSQMTSPFRAYVEGNDVLATNWSYDTVEARGESAAPGTPWNTDEVIYERGLALQVLGEFVTDPATLQLIPLAEIQVVMTPEGFPDQPSLIQVPPAVPPAELPLGARFGL